MRIENLIGTPVSTNIESRIFNAVSLFITVALIANAFINYILGLPVLALLMMVTAGISFLLYYISRIKKN